MNQHEEEEEWTDITHIFTQGALQLSNNDILLAPHLSLLDIVSAIEIMDPRMDSGVGRTTQEQVQFNPLQPLTPSQVATIIDLSLACEVTWYTGRLLSQTVLTSSYLHHLDTLKSHPDPLVKFVLRAYLLGLTKSCAIISDEISQDNLRQNEDVNSEQQIIDMYLDIDVTQTLEELDEAYSILKCWPNELDDYRISLMERIRFRIEFLYSLALLSSSPTVPMVSYLEAHLHSAREAIQSIRLDPTYPATSSISFTAQNPSVQSAFNPNFHQTVTSHSPPRPVHFPDTFHDLAAMVQRILEELAVVYQIALGNSFSDWLSFFHAFSRRDPIAFPFVRSYLMSIFQNENVIALNPNQTLSWLGRECLSDLSAGKICYPSNPSNPNRYLLDRLSGFLVNYFSAFAANRPRGRRILSNSLCEWKALYNTTWVNPLDLPDSTLQGLQMLIYYFSIESGLQVSLMGFDLELYELNNDRLAMWWVVERLSERAWLLLNKLSEGAESLDGRLMRILGKLAGVAAQLTRRKHEQSGRPLSELKLRRAVFERRIRPLIARDASFDDSSLVVSQLALPRPLLDYHTMVSSLLSTPPLQPQDLHHILADVMEQLGQVSALARRQKRVGLSQFQAYIDCLTRATEKLIATNRADVMSLEVGTKPEDECALSLGSLKISSPSSPGPEQYGLDGDGPDHGPLPRPVPPLGQASQDVAARWFLVN